MREWIERDITWYILYIVYIYILDYILYRTIYRFCWVCKKSCWANLSLVKIHLQISRVWWKQCRQAQMSCFPATWDYLLPFARSILKICHLIHRASMFSIVFVVADPMGVYPGSKSHVNHETEIEHRPLVKTPLVPMCPSKRALAQVDFGSVQLKEIHLSALDEMGDDGAGADAGRFHGEIANGEWTSSFNVGKPINLPFGSFWIHAVIVHIAPVYKFYGHSIDSFFLGFTTLFPHKVPENDWFNWVHVISCPRLRWLWLVLVTVTSHNHD